MLALVRTARRVLDLVTFYLVLPITAAVLGTVSFVIWLVASHV